MKRDGKKKCQMAGALVPAFLNGRPKSPAPHGAFVSAIRNSVNGLSNMRD